MATYGSTAGGGGALILLIVLAIAGTVIYGVAWMVDFVLTTIVYPVYGFFAGLIGGIAAVTAGYPVIVFALLAVPGVAIGLVFWEPSDSPDTDEMQLFYLANGVAGGVGLAAMYGLVTLIRDGVGLVEGFGVLVLALVWIASVIACSVTTLSFSTGAVGAVSRAGVITALLWWGWITLFGGRLDAADIVFGIGATDGLLTMVLVLAVAAVLLTGVERTVTDRIG